MWVNFNLNSFIANEVWEQLKINYKLSGVTWNLKFILEDYAFNYDFVASNSLFISTNYDNC